MDGNTKTLADLIGLHTLTGVDFGTLEYVRWDGRVVDVNAIFIELDGVTYVATEDYNDGYRSAMDELLEIPARDFQNRLPETQVCGVWVQRSKYNKDDLVGLIDIVNGKTVVVVGTDKADDYYPSFVSEYTPQNLHWND